jgi:hypothetical protein
MHVARSVETVAIDVRTGKGTHRPECRQHRPIAVARQDDGHPRRPFTCHNAAIDVHASLGEAVEHEMAEEVVTHDAYEGGPQSEPRGATRDDGAGSSDREVGTVEKRLDLAKGWLDVTAQYEVWIAIPENEQIQISHDG